MAVRFVLLLIGAYLLGAVPVAYIAARLYKGIDIRQYGSGNVGATNVIKSTNVWIGTLVIILDLVKGVAMVWVAKLLDMGIASQTAIGVAAVIGHNWSVFLGFNGGRGLLITLGLAAFLPIMNNLIPWGLLVLTVIAVTGLFVTHDTALGVLLGVISLPLVTWWTGQPMALTLGFLAMLIIMVIRRLTAPSSRFGESVSRAELMMNRFLFDRDIRDRKTWLSRSPGT
ncbi:MAG: glycerol-3-phosphate acyltransferase [Chloroflexota bacterium]